MMAGPEDLETPTNMTKEAFEAAHVELVQWKREVSCAVNMTEKLQPYVSGMLDDAAFKEQAQKWAEELSATAMGKTLLRSIGYCYKRQAQLALGTNTVSGGIGDRLKGAESYWRNAGHSMSNYGKMASAAFGTYSSMSAIQAHEQEKAQAIANSPTKPADEAPAAEEETEKEKKLKEDMAGAVIAMLWSTIVVEIESTLEEVCFKVTRDSSITQPERKRRAEGLVIMGRVFFEKGVPSEVGLAELVAKMGGEMAGDVGAGFPGGMPGSE